MPRKKKNIESVDFSQTILNELNQSNIDWLKIAHLANQAYAEQNKMNSPLGFTKGFINYYKIGSHDSSAVKEQVKEFYPYAKIYYFGSKTYCNKFLRESELSVQEITDDLVIILSDKDTIEGLFNQYQLPYIKFTGGRTRTYKRYKDENGVDRMRYEVSYRIKKGTGKLFKWKAGDAKMISRDSKLLEIFES